MWRSVLGQDRLVERAGRSADAELDGAVHLSDTLEHHGLDEVAGKPDRLSDPFLQSGSSLHRCWMIAHRSEARRDGAIPNAAAAGDDVRRGRATAP